MTASIREGGENPSAVAAHSRNAELKATLAEARAVVAQLERLIELVPGAVWQSEGFPTRPGYRMPYVSGKIKETLGYTYEECLVTPTFWNSIGHPDDSPRVARELTELATTGGRLSEHRFITKDGREVWVQSHISLNRDASGAIIGRNVVAPDVTARVLAERAREELRRRQADLSRRLDSLVASAPGVLWELRGRGDLSTFAPVFVSDHLEAMTGFTREEILGSPALWRDLTHPDDRAQVAAELSRLSSAAGGRFESRWLTKSGEALWVSSQLRVARDAAGDPVAAYGLTLDISARKAAEAEAERLAGEVLRAQSAAIAERSAPLIPIAEGVIVMPLVGALSAPRGERVVEALVQGISRARARVALVDLTGVYSVHADAVSALLAAARGARLLGAEVVLTGIGPEVAAALAAREGDLRDIRIRRSLARGVAYALGRRRSPTRR